MIQKILTEEGTLENDREIFLYFYFDVSSDLLCRGKQDGKKR
jgi:hypothetical protein